MSDLTDEIKRGRDAYNMIIRPLFSQCEEADGKELKKISGKMNTDINVLWKKIDGVTPPIPPLPDFPKANPDMIAQFLGLNNWYKIIGWKEADQAQADELLRETLVQCRLHEFSLTDSFLWLSSGKAEHSHLNFKTPMMYQNGKFNHSKKNTRFWELQEQFLEIHKEVGIPPCTQLWMRPAYCEFPFRENKNVNGLTRFYSDKSAFYQSLMAEWIMETYRKVYGPDYNPTVKIMNEPPHHSGKSFHTVMYFHEMIYKDVLAQYLPLKNLHLDLHSSEAPIGELREDHPCPKPDDCDRNKRHGQDGYGRSAIGEKHAFSTKTDFVNLLNQEKNFFTSGNPVRYFTEDAGGAAKDGKGEVWGPHIFGGVQQQYEMAKFMWTKAKRYRKRLIYGSFPVECLKGGFLPDYRAEVIHWDRFKMLAKAHKEVYD